MHPPNQHLVKKASAIAAFSICSALALLPTHAVAQMPMPSPTPDQSQAQPGAATEPQDTQAQITDLRQQVVKLQAALQQSNAKKTSSSKGTMKDAKPAMGMGDESGEMGSMPGGAAKDSMAPMKDDAGEMGGMPPSSGAMGAGDEQPMGGNGCCGMSMGKPMAKPSGMQGDKMTSMSGGSMPSKSTSPMSNSEMAEAPHVLHVGAKDFFLDHAQHIRLTADQKASLEKAKSSSLSNKATAQKQIDVAEQELWQLTSADQPNTPEIDMKVQEIAKIQADEQLTFIHAVYAASRVLTPEQRAEVVQPVQSMRRKVSKMSKAPTDAPMEMQ